MLTYTNRFVREWRAQSKCLTADDLVWLWFGVPPAELRLGVVARRGGVLDDKPAFDVSERQTQQRGYAIDWTLRVLK